MALYTAMFYGGLILAIIFLIAAGIIFFVMDIPKAFGVVTGKTQRKAIEEIRAGKSGDVFPEGEVVPDVLAVVAVGGGDDIGVDGVLGHGVPEGLEGGEHEKGFLSVWFCGRFLYYSADLWKNG